MRRAKFDDTLVVRVPGDGKARWRTLAEWRGEDLSDWARRALEEAAQRQLRQEAVADREEAES